MDALTLKKKTLNKNRQKTRAEGNQTTSTGLVVTFPDWIKEINK